MNAPLPAPTPLVSLPAIPVLEGLAQLHQAVLVVDRRGQVQWASEGIAATFGVTCGRTPRSWDDFFAGLETAASIREELMTRGRVVRERVDIRRDGAPPLPAELSIARLAGGDTAEPLFLATIRPLAQGEVSARALRHTLDYLAAVLDSSPEAVVAVDDGGGVTYANPAVEGILAFAPDEIVGRSVCDLLHDAGDLAALLRPAAEPHRQDVELSRRDGRSICVAVSASPLRLPDGTRVGSVAFLRDVTERRRFEAELARKNAELENYVHSVSHDLRSPLVALLGFSRLLRQDHGDQLGESGRHFLDRIEQAGRTMEALINDLLELSRIGQTGERRSLVDPLKILHQLRAELKPRLEAQGVKLTVPDSPPLVLCDRTRLYQVFSNLIGNALEHMGPCPSARIDIDVREESGRHRITVRDNGRGIDPAHHERIFELFQSLGPRADGRRGTGVGLAIVKKIAETHGGEVWVESRPGAGAAFHLTLPRG
jgi:PAS domain S-box-containing protein